jgi:hypothetical protein
MDDAPSVRPVTVISPSPSSVAVAPFVSANV